jgi:hypothetical protein
VLTGKSLRGACACYENEERYGPPAGGVPRGDHK